jgi:hypothetical protein
MLPMRMTGNSPLAMRLRTVLVLHDQRWARSATR